MFQRESAIPMRFMNKAACRRPGSQAHAAGTCFKASRRDSRALNMMSNALCSFLLSVSLASSLMLFAVCEASAEGDALRTILQTMNYQYTYNATDPCTWNPQVVQCNSPTSGSITGLWVHSPSLIKSRSTLISLPELATFELSRSDHKKPF
jgi:hypothetical protein